MKHNTSIGLLLALVLAAGLAPAQFVYEFKTTPDSVEVFMNGLKQGKTPLKVKFRWENVPSTGIEFVLRKDGFVEQKFAVTEKPRVIHSEKNFTMERLRPHFELDSATALVDFDRVLVEFASGKVIGKSGYSYSSQTQDLTWEGYSRLASEDFVLKAYDILGNAGFNTVQREGNQLFSSEKRVRRTPRFVVAGKITDMWLDIRVNGAYSYSYNSDMRMTIEWQVLDRSSNKVIIKESTSAREMSTIKGSPNMVPVMDLFAEVLYKFLGSGKLYEAVKAAGSTSTVAAAPDEVGGAEDEEETVASTTLKPVTLPKFESNPEMIQFATQACVTVSTDAGHGSGVIVSDDGLVITAAHVIEGVNRLAVIFSNGVELEAKVLVQDDRYDVALLKVPGSKYKALPMGKGLTVGLGEEAITIGTPTDIELGQSISKGIISGKRKHEDILYIQTDVAVSPGNSGGPLMNTKGQIIGIIQRKLIGDGIEGVGFALPIETAMKQLGLQVAEE